jgi:hypothetical protein
MTSPKPAAKPSSVPTPKPNSAPAPKPSAVPKPNPVPVPAPKPNPVAPKCIYSPNDALALEIRKVIYNAPSSCKSDVNYALKNYANYDKQLVFQASATCKTYVAKVINDHVNFNMSTLCSKEISGGLAVYNKTYVGGVIHYMPHSSCSSYLKSFITDFFAHTTDSAHMVGCNSSLSVVVSPH